MNILDVLPVFASLALYLSAPNLLRWWQTHNRPGRPSREVRALLAHDDFAWSDSLYARGGAIHIDPRGGGHFLLAPCDGIPSIIEFEDVTEWGYTDLRNANGHHVGWRFQVATNDPRNALTIVDIRGVDRGLPDAWKAKVGAYVTRPARPRLGIGLIEIAMGLGVAALIIAAALAYFSNANENRRINDVLGEVGTIRTAVSSVYDGTASLEDLTTSDIAGSGFLSHKYISEDRKRISNVYGGPVYVYGFANTFFGYDILFLGLSKQACLQVGLAGFSMGQNLIQTVINPPDGIPSAGGFGSYGLEFGAWQRGVIANCNKSANTVRFSVGAK